MSSFSFTILYYGLLCSFLIQLDATPAEKVKIIRPFDLNEKPEAEEETEHALIQIKDSGERMDRSGEVDKRMISLSEYSDQRMDKPENIDQRPEDSDHRREKSERSDEGMDRSENVADQDILESEDSEWNYMIMKKNIDNIMNQNSAELLINGKAQSSMSGNNKKKNIAKKKKTKDEVTKIMDQYDAIKKENPRLSIDQIANMLNVPYANLMFWKRKSAKKRLGPKQRSELWEKYLEIKQKNRRISDKCIAKQLDVCQDTLLKLKKQFDLFLYSHRTPEEKAELLLRSQEIILKTPNCEIGKIEEILGVSYKTLQSWRQKSENQRQLPLEEKAKIVRKYREIVRENPEFEDINVAEMLGVSFNNLNKWSIEVESPENSMKQDQLQKLRRANLHIRNSIFGTELYSKINDATRNGSNDKS